MGSKSVGVWWERPCIAKSGFLDALVVQTPPAPVPLMQLDSYEPFGPLH